MREWIVQLAMKFVGTPYIWGGSTPAGFDCSGFVIWIRQVFDLLPSGDWAAADLYRINPKTDEPEPGDLVFYGKSKDAITHVMMYIGTVNGEPYCVGASGGDSSTRTIEDARRRGACVKIKPVHYRTDFVGYTKMDKYTR